VAQEPDHHPGPSAIERLNAVLAHREPSRTVAIARIALGVCLVGKGFEYTLNVARLLQPETMRVPWVQWAPDLTAPAAIVLLVAWFTAAVCFTEGRQPRLAAGVLLSILAYLCAWDQQLYSYHTYLVFLFTFLLALTEPGAALARGGGERSETVTGWPLTLMRLQITIVYLFAVVSKLDSPWLRENVMARHLGLDPVAIDRTLGFGLDAAVIALEAFLAVGLWSRRLRPWAFVIGFALHLSFPVVLQPRAPLAIFSLASLAPYILFLDGRPRTRLVRFDPASPPTARLARWLQRLDWLRLHTFAPAAGAPWELRAAATTHRGRRAIVAVLEGLPLTFLWAPALRFLGRGRQGRGGLAH
jgi:hypothetical protein